MLKTMPDVNATRIETAFSWLLPTTVFLSAYLLFQVQPLISKFILPWFGGSPTVWTTAMLFFQCVLFGGYAYAHLTSRYLSLRQQTQIHLALLGVSALLAAFILPSDLLKPTGQEHPLGRILVLLGCCVGVPYFTLATTGPLIQAWFARVYPHRSPYRLYSLSNVGSFVALLSFPYLFEPFFELPQMGRLWTVGYWLFVISCGCAAYSMLRMASEVRQSNEDSRAAADSVEPISVWHRLAWVGLPAMASLTLVAVTDHVSHNVAPEPQLWIATLSLYLLTFIITFDHERWYRRAPVAAACLLSIALLTAQSDLERLLGIDWSFGVTGLRWTHLTVMFLICFVCHGELVRLKPKSHQHLTEFYLCMSAGGACGSLFVTFVAVNLFVEYHEWPLCLLLGSLLSACVLTSVLRYRVHHRSNTNSGRPREAVIPLLAGIAASACVLYWEDPLDWRSSGTSEYEWRELYADRNFYGAVSAVDRPHKSDAKQSYRSFYSGTIAHGCQFTDPDQARLPTSYYGPTSGVARTLQYAQSKLSSMRVALVGLGTGTLATYARAEDNYDFYEINPQVVHIANEYFTYLPECRAKTQIILGDARLKLAAAPEEQRYDMIVLDAFTGGSVPVHLLTKEAFAIYEKHLKPEGYLVVHTTNTYLNLYPIVERQGTHLGLSVRHHFDPADSDNLVRATRYVTLTRDQDYLGTFSNVPEPKYDDKDRVIGEVMMELPNAPLWTDHYSSLSAIQWPR